MRTNSIIAGLALILGAATFAAAGAPLTQEQGIKIMSRPGAWIEADGALLADGTLMAKEVEIHAKPNPAELESPAIYGAVTQINLAKSTMRVLGYLVTWDERTTLKYENKRQIPPPDLQDGMSVKIEGTLQPNGSFKATKIKVHNPKVRDGKIRVKEKILGPVTVVDAGAGKLRILNTPIKLSEDAVLDEAVVTPKTP